MFEKKSENLEDFAAVMTALECTYSGCTAGEGGAKFRTPALEQTQAIERLGFHREYAHGRQVPAWTSPTSSLDEFPRPVLTSECSQDSFMSFKRKWVQYVKYYERDGGGKKEDGEIKIQ